MGALVMVIDDSLTVRKILEATLQRAGFQAALYGDGTQAWKVLTSGAIPPPDAILVDVGLPQVDGYSLVRRFRQQPAFRSVPILLLSGHTSLVDRLRGRMAGASAYLTKPFRPEQIIAELRRLQAKQA